MTWATRILAVIGLWFVLSIAVFGMLPALRHLRRRTIAQYGGDGIDAELRSLLDQETGR